MPAKTKPENVIKKQEARLQEAYTIFTCQILMEHNKAWSEAMTDRVQKFLKSFQ